jgi:predicted permease
MEEMMRALRRVLKRLTSWTTRNQDEDRLRAEIEEHLVLQTEDAVRAGLPPVEARRQAVIKFGAVESIRESYRDRRGLPHLEAAMRDLRYGMRGLRKAPAFTVTSILVLALGIGATTSIFTLMYAVLFRSLSVANPSELYRLGKAIHCCDYGGYSQFGGFSIVSYDLYKHFRDKTKGFTELAAFQANQSLFGVRRPGSSEPAQSDSGEFVSGNYFAMFGINAHAGRLLTKADDRPGAAPAAVMSYRLWRQQYGADPSLIGRVLDLDGKPFTLVGVTPPGFFGDTLRNTPTDFFLALAAEPVVQGVHLNRPDDHWLDLIGRIKPGASPASIEAQMRMELKQWLRSHWDEMNSNERTKFPDQTLYLSPGGAGITSMREDYEHWLQVLMAVSVFVLLIVCVNVANLMLVRGMERRQQTSLSMALGARASRLVTQAFTESILLSLIGGAVGLIVAFACTRLILHFAFPPSAGTLGIPIDAAPSMPVLLFTFGVSLVTGAAFGIAPAWMATRADPIEALRGADRSTTRRDLFSRKTLVVLQAALSLVLLSSSGLLTLALHNLENQSFGFEQARRTIVNIDPLLAGYSAAQLTPLYARIHDALSGVPGVASVALCLYSPQSGDSWNDGIWVDGRPDPGPNENNSASWVRATPGFFEAIGDPIVRGRAISERDTDASRHVAVITDASRHVAVINEAFARKFFGDADPIGQHFGRGETGSNRQFEVVGVAKDARYLSFDFDKPIGPFFFLPEAQYTVFPTPANTQSDRISHFLHDIVIVSKPGVSLSLAQVRQTMASVDPSLPLVGIRALSEQVAGQFNQQRLIARLTSFFGFLSLVLSSIGLYGVTAYNARRRVNEIGVRMALGADRSHVVALVLRGAFTLVVVGLLIGVPLTIVAGRLLESQLYGMTSYHPGVTLLAALALALSALFASLIPALHAGSISPMKALREE